MFTDKKPVMMICETSVHAGSGSDLGIIDLPIQREKHTSYPKFESSGIKGMMRQYFRSVFDLSELEKYFGPEPENSDNLESTASCIGFMDGRILLFPVKSVKGVFAYVTCPDVLKRFMRDMLIADFNEFSKLEEINPGDICQKSRLLAEKNTVILEEYAFEDCVESEKLTDFAFKLAKILDGKINQYWAEKLKRDIIVISDDDFSDFVNLYSEVNARIKINPDTGTVAKGALWYEEFIPTDTIMYSMLMTSNSFGKTKESAKDVMNKILGEFPEMLQIGGDATIGKGLIRLVVPGGKNE